MEPELRTKYLEFLSPFVSDHKKEIIEQVLEMRTRFITIVLEDIYQTQNASAVLRTCECLGIQDVYIIEKRNSFKINPDVVRGAAKWITLHKFTGKNSTRECFEQLRSLGYAIIGSAPEEKNMALTEFNPKVRFALVFGTELEGLSEYANKNVDKTVRIPMFGFTESFNLSVSAGICLQHAITNLRQSDHDWKLNDDEKNDLRVNWYQGSIRNGLKLKSEFLRLKRHTS